MDKDQGSVPIPNPSLDSDVIVEILSWLPVLALLRLKLVCKEWKYLIESENFKFKHYARSIACVCRERQLEHRGVVELLIRDVYQCLGIYYGMIVERGVFCERYRIRNPVLRRVIELPDPHEGVLGIFLSHLPSPGDFKLISLFDHGKEAGNGCEILSLDGNANASWRKMMSFPILNELGGKVSRTKFISIGTVVHCILLVNCSSELWLHILSVDIEKEEFLGIIKPNFRFPNVITIEPFLYNGELGFAQIVPMGLQVYSLVDCKDVVQKIVLPLNFLARSPKMRYDLMILCVHGSEIWFNCGGWEIFVYDIVLQRITSRKTLLYLERYAFPLKPSLFAIKGMERTQMITANCYTELQRV